MNILPPKSLTKLGNNGQSARGIALFLVLIFVSIVAFALASSSRFILENNITVQARAAGDEAVLLSRAARLYARDEFVRPLGGMGITPRVLDINTLITQNLLPANFGNPTAGVYKNALGQEMHVILDNINGVLGAYIALFPDPDPTKARYTGAQAERTTNIVVQTLRSAGMPLNPPVFDATGGLSLAYNCGTVGNLNAVSTWDTGCLRRNRYQTRFRPLIAGLPDATAFQGALIIPSWRIYTPDSRALSRYAQPENPGANTMTTDLYLARTTGIASPCLTSSRKVQRMTTTNEIIPEDFLDANKAPICNVLNDDAATDRRFDINFLQNLNGSNILVARQGNRFGGPSNDTFSGNDPITGLPTYNAIRLKGPTVITGNVLATESTAVGANLGLRTINTNTLTITGIPTDATPTGNGSITSDKALSATTLSVNTLNTNDYTTNNLVATNAKIGVSGNFTTRNLVGDGSVNSEIASTQLNANSDLTVGTVNINNTANMQGGIVTTKPDTTSSINTSGDPWIGITTDPTRTRAPIIITNLNGTNTGSVNGTTTTENLESFASNNVIERVDTEVCFSVGGSKCPDGRAKPPCIPGGPILPPLCKP